MDDRKLKTETTDGSILEGKALSFLRFVPRLMRLSSYFHVTVAEGDATEVSENPGVSRNARVVSPRKVLQVRNPTLA